MSDADFLADVQRLLRQLNDTSETVLPLGGITRALMLRLLEETGDRLAMIGPGGMTRMRARKLETK